MKQRLEALLQRADKDGKLSKEEAPPLVKAGFERLDADKDGALGGEELRRAVMELARRLNAGQGRIDRPPTRRPAPDATVRKAPAHRPAAPRKPEPKKE